MESKEVKLKLCDIFSKYATSQDKMKYALDAPDQHLFTQNIKKNMLDKMNNGYLYSITDYINSIDYIGKSLF
jgi:CRISPR/Cas system endoribonuclease Cas6 (RAMP superfamily)